MSAVDAREGSRVETLRLDAVALDPRNARAHPARNVAAVASSLAQLGAGRSIVLDRDNRVVAGNCTVEQARAAGFDRLLVVEPQPGELVAVRRPDWTPAEATAYGLVDNRSAEFAEWHPENLALAIETVRLECPEVVLDFKPVELAAIMPRPPVTEDEVPEPQVEVFAQRGDIICCGPHRVMCGDSTSAEDVAALLAGEKPGLMVTDPPYGVAYDGGQVNEKKRETLHGDTSTSVLSAAIALAATIMPAGAWYVWHAGRVAEPVYAAIAASGYEVRALLIWNKLKAHYGAPSAHYCQKHDPCLYAVRGSADFIGPSNEVTVWDIEQPSRNELHPTQKPVECMARPIRNHSHPDVYDPFLGSGTTLIAADQLGRRAFGMELEPRYCDVVVRRYLAHCAKTGRAPEVTGWRGSE